MAVLLFPLLVLDFASGAAFWGMAALAAPIVVHLLFRQRPRVVAFPAIRFLLASRRQTARRFRLKQLLLLLLRLALIAGLVTALAGPRLTEHHTGATGSKRRVNAVIILDSSYSMACVGRDRSSRFHRAKALALQMLDLFSPDSRLALIFCADRPDVAVGAFTFDRTAIREKINQSRHTCRPTDCAAALAEAYRLFRTEDITEARVIFLLTDCTANGWRALPHEAGPLARGTPVFVIDVGGERDENRCVALPNPDLGTASVGLPFPIEARVALPPSISAATVELSVDGKVRDERYLRAGGPATCALQFLPERPGLFRGFVGLRGKDALAADDRAYFAAPCGAQRKVVLVDGETARTRGPSDAFFLTRALAPPVAGAAAALDCQLVVPSGVSKTAIHGAQAVFLVDVPRLTNTQWRALAEHVAAGGALIIFAGPQIDAASYNAHGHDKLDPRGSFLPCSFGAVRSGGEPFRFRLGQFAHPLLRPFETDNPNLGLPRFSACLETVPRKAKGANVILEFTNGLPALLEQEYGRGRVLVFTSGAGSRWSSFPQVPHAYVPFVHELLRYGARARARPAWVHVGDAVEVAAPSGKPLRSARVRPPEAGRWTPVVLPRDEQGRLPTGVALPSTERPGIYRVELSDGEVTTTEFVAVNVDTRESAPERIDAEQLAAFVPGGRVHVVREVRELRDLLEVGGSVTDLNRYLLPLLLVLLIAELLLANHMYARAPEERGVGC